MQKNSGQSDSLGVSQMGLKWMMVFTVWCFTFIPLFSGLLIPDLRDYSDSTFESIHAFASGPEYHDFVVYPVYLIIGVVFNPEIRDSGESMFETVYMISSSIPPKDIADPFVTTYIICVALMTPFALAGFLYSIYHYVPTKCQLCGVSLSRRDRKKHILAIHPLTCEICMNTMPHWNYMMAHKLIYHSGIATPLTCPFCSHIVYTGAGAHANLHISNHINSRHPEVLR